MGISVEGMVYWGFDLDECVDEPHWQVMADHGCDLAVHGSGEYDPIQYIAIKDSMQSCSWDSSETLKALEVDPSWEEKLRGFCRVIGVSYKQPAWRFAVYCG